MAYIGQDKKKEIRAELKKFMPKSWKWSLAIRHYSEIVMTIRQAPAVDTPDILEHGRGVNEYYIDEHYGDRPELCALLKRISAALNNGNHNNNDIMTDYFDVGWYTTLQFGKWDKPFVAT